MSACQVNKPDWHKLAEISARGALESQEPGWNMERWRVICDEAAIATNGNSQFSEFMARYLATSRREQAHSPARARFIYFAIQDRKAL